MTKRTEADSPYRHLETWSTAEILQAMSREDRTVADAVAAVLPAIAALADAIVESMQSGGRLFYIGAGTSGRLGILDASECPPTFGVPATWVTGLIAGGDQAIRKAVEGAEDDPGQAILDLREAGMSPGDVVVGIAASGTTPYVFHGLQACRAEGIVTGCITCNPDAPVIRFADWPVVVDTGPEFLTGSTRLKAGTAQKMVLNMLSTSAMIRLGRVMDNKMVDMQLTNRKLIERGVGMIMEKLGWTPEQAREALLAEGSVRNVFHKLAVDQGPAGKGDDGPPAQRR